MRFFQRRGPGHLRLDALKDAEIIDVPTWRFIQRLGDLRNLCDHKKSAEPTKDDVTELIAGTEKITKTIA